VDGVFVIIHLYKTNIKQVTVNLQYYC